MTYQIEVCIDSMESLHQAISGGATRIELCSALDLGGLTPSYGLMKQAVKASTVPVYAMIRPRQGDFLYQDEDIACMLEDIDAARRAGVQGVVFGALLPNGDIDMPCCRELTKASKGLGCTFHRAIDQCRNYTHALENIAELGCERILTSGLHIDAYRGKEIIAKMSQLAGGRFSIMAGAGVNAGNVADIVTNTGIREVHLSGKSLRPSRMLTMRDNVRMGNPEADEQAIPVTDRGKIAKVVAALKSLA